MTTARDIIKRSMRQLGVYSIGEDPTDDEAADGLEALNAMVESWALENLFVYAKSELVIPLVANQRVITIGPTGDIVTPRPIIIDDSSYVTLGEVSYPLDKLGLDEYNQIALKGLITGIPTSIWPLMNTPNVQITIWPAPSQDMALHLWSTGLLESFLTLDTVIALPPGYERALSFSLSEEIASEYEVGVPISVTQKALKARKNIKRTNTVVPIMNMPAGIPQSGWWGTNGWAYGGLRNGILDTSDDVLLEQ